MQRWTHFRFDCLPRQTRWRALRAAAVLALAFSFFPAGHTDSTFKTAPAGPLSASAHIDFRITILPSLALSLQPQALHVQGTGGVLTLQSSSALAWDGRAPTRSVQLRPRQQVVDTSIPAAQFGSAALITIAAP